MRSLDLSKNAPILLWLWVAALFVLGGISGGVAERLRLESMGWLVGTYTYHYSLQGVPGNQRIIDLLTRWTVYTPTLVSIGVLFGALTGSAIALWWARQPWLAGWVALAGGGFVAGQLVLMWFQPLRASNLSGILYLWIAYSPWAALLMLWGYGTIKRRSRRLHYIPQAMLLWRITICGS